MVPSAVDKQLLLRKWVKASPNGLVNQLSDLVPSADHTLSALEAQQWFAERVLRFLEGLERTQTPLPGVSICIGTSH